MLQFKLYLVTFLFVLFAFNTGFCTIIPTSLSCEYRVNPLGLDESRPRLSWILESNQHNQKQSAYQILCASDKSLLQQDIGDLWDSRKTNSDESVHISYAGQPLKSRMQIYWKVRVWDMQNHASQWSEPAFFSMGLLENSEWQAQWISYNTNDLNQNPDLHLPPCPFMRKEFQSDKKIKSATIYVSSLGLFELSLNGQRVGSDYFTPGWTNYNKRVYYFTYDVTNLVQPGENAIGAILAEGWYADYIGYSILVNWPQKKNFYGKTPALITQLEIEYEDGSKNIISTDETWKATTGSIRESSMLMGEMYDARLEIKNWNKTGLDDKDWQHVTVMPDYPGELQAYPGVPVQKTEEITPVELTEPQEGVYVFNLGQNFAGYARLKIKGAAGTRVTLRFAEMLHKDGNIMTENLRKARATDVYILKGDPQGEIWEPRFTYHGFQYVEVTGLTEKPDLDTVTGVVLHSNTPVAGFLECSSEMVNKLYKNITWTQRSNYVDIPTDCPQRDERLGWTGDAQIYIRSASYNMDIGAFFKKWIRDLNDEQRAEGYYPNFAPVAFHRTSDQHYYYSPGWMDAGIVCPYTLYQVYNDKRILKTFFDNMKKQIQFYIDIAEDYTINEDIQAWGDWLSFGAKTSNHYIATAYFAYDTRLMIEMAHALGRTQDVTYYETLFEKIQQAFIKKYWTPEETFRDDTQTAYAMAIYMKLLPKELEQKAAERLAQLINQNNNHLTTGFIGCKHLLPALSEYGYDDLAYTLLTNTTFPSWGYEVVNNATTIWEHWDSYTIKDGFKGSGMNSFNHYGFGAVNEWMFRYMAGIDTEGAGFKEILIQPHIGDRQITWVHASYHSIRGLIKSRWRVDGSQFYLNVTIPANTTATVMMPGALNKMDKEQLLQKDASIKIFEQNNEKTTLKIGSGSYQFVSNLK